MSMIGVLKPRSLFKVMVDEECVEEEVEEEAIPEEGEVKPQNSNA